MVATLDGALAASDIAALRAAYGPFVPRFDGVAVELAQLYPGRCPRLLANRSLAEAPAQSLGVNAQMTVAAILALRAGLVDLGQNLDIRIRQDSPDEFVGEQSPESDVPTVTGTPTWNSPRTQELATRACAACHSNQPVWPWYTNVAPFSWYIQHQVDDGRAVLNFSEWDRPQPGIGAAAASVQVGRMPPAQASTLDKRLALTDAERAELAAGLQASFYGSTPAPAVRAAANNGPELSLLLLVGLTAVALAMAFAVLRQTPPRGTVVRRD
jgi:hypothetical protein